jgi:signal transduction histidine kinase
MDNSKHHASRWPGKSAEDVLAISLHELRNPVARLTGYLQFLKSTGLSEEQSRKFIDMGLDCALSTQEILDDISQYISEQRKNE